MCEWCLCFGECESGVCECVGCVVIVCVVECVSGDYECGSEVFECVSGV